MKKRIMNTKSKSGLMSFEIHGLVFVFITFLGGGGRGGEAGTSEAGLEEKVHN